MKMMKRTILKILMFAVFCLPFSLVNSLSLLHLSLRAVSLHLLQT